MQSKATLRYLRIAPRKVRLVADLVRGKKVSDAQTLLKFVSHSSAEPVAKMIRSAAVSAAQRFQADEGNLYIANIMVSEGPKLKRYRPRARGRAYPIQKKTSHITLILDEVVPSKAGVPVPAEEQKKETRGAAKKQRTGFRPEKEIRKAKSAGVAQRIFRRKAA